MTYVLWGMPYWLDNRIKIMAGTLAECRKAKEQREREQYHGADDGPVWVGLAILPKGECIPAR